MKKILKFFVVILIAFVFLVGCDMGGSTQSVIEVTAKQEKVNISDIDVSSYDFKSLFTITKDGKNVAVQDKYLDTTSLSDKVGSYIVTCTYEGKMATIVVNVTTGSIVEANVDSVEVQNVYVNSYNYKELFTITSEGNEIEVLDEYLDLSKLRASAGTYIIYCTYQGVSASVTVNVTEVTYQLKLSEKEITVKQSDVETYDFKALFTAVVGGKIQEITEDMINSNVQSEVGTYQFSVTLGESSMTLTVNVVTDSDIEIINSYKLLEIEEKDLEDFDFTSLFTIYSDGVSQKVTKDMIDKSSLDEISQDGIYTIKVNYTVGKTKIVGTCSIKVIPTSAIVITPKNIVTYPNGEHIDLTTLFEIRQGDKKIPVTSDMITGSIDYSTVGLNEIKINYDGISATATVEVKQGVIINYAKKDVIEIGKGTSKSSYAFEKDFIVLINGIKFTNIAEYIKKDNVDFNTVGEYQAVIEIPYTDTSLEYAKGTVFTKTITYKVVDVIYDIQVANKVITLPTTTTSFDAFKNLSVKINGVNQKLTNIPTQVSVISTYAKVVSEELDFDYVGMQNVKVAVYVYGVDKDPVYVEYQVIMESDILIETKDVFIFEGKTLYTKDLFTIKVGSKEIEVTQDMIEGKVDTHKHGVYQVTINYEGIEKTANVIVLNPDMVGTYKTLLTTIPEGDSTDEEGYESTGTKARPIGNLYITDEGVISVDGKLATILYGIDDNAMYIKIGAYEFELYYENGVVVLIPENNIKLSYINDKRPLIYFNEANWELKEHVIINSLSAHILEQSSVGYSFDIFNVINKEDESSKWYALEIDLFEKYQSDTIYEVTHGFVEFDESFQMETGINSSLTYCGVEYKFSMTSNKVGKILLEDETTKYKYSNMSFSGTFDGQNATLTFSAYENITFQIGTRLVFSMTGLEARSLLNGGIDYENNSLYLYDEGKNGKNPFAYQFDLDLENNTFTYLEKDIYYGKYESSNMFIFVDGYGKGIINFNKSQYKVYQFEYTVEGNIMKITYLNTKSTFKYGHSSTLYIDALYNTLTAKEFEDESINGLILENTDIIDGAVIHVLEYVLPTYSNKVLGRKALFDLIEIITKDGVITDNNIKTSMINISDIDFAVKGFYHFSITVNINGNDVVMHYALQIK